MSNTIMSHTPSLTILTPTYNRKELLKNLFDSLRDQTSQDFQWLIIDDGSTDGTCEAIESLPEHNFRLDYYRKPNGGKHTALNYSHSHIESELVCIVDSDDILIPKAVETIVETANEYLQYKNIKAMTFLRGSDENTPICKSFPNRSVISNHIDFRLNGNRAGDCFEVLLTETFREFPFPEYRGETFMGEGYLWNNVGFKYDTVYVPKVLYICKYRNDGLTRAGRELRIRNPYGGIANSNSYFCKANGRRVNTRLLAKEAMLVVCYGKFAGMGHAEIRALAKDKMMIEACYIPGLALYALWKIKYKIGAQVSS